MKPELQIAKAAKLVDLRGDREGAIVLLTGLLDDSDGAEAKLQIEVLTFLADLWADAGNIAKALESIDRAKRITVPDTDIDWVAPHLERCDQLRTRLTNMDH